MIGVALSTHDLVKTYGSRRALDRFTLAVPQGAVMGLVGPNGAGKTTWMMTVAGFIRPTSGHVDLLGRGAFDAVVHSGRVSILPQDSELPLEACAAELLYRYGRIQGLSSDEARRASAEVLAAVNLSDRSRAPIRALSHGMRKRVMLAQCFLGSPEVILLDEPLNGLDPVEQDRVRRFILSRRGRQTIVVSSHNLHDVEVLCSHVALVAKGRVAQMSTIQALTRQTGVVEYGLAGIHGDRSVLETALAEALPGLNYEWRGGPTGEDVVTLVCTFEGVASQVSTVNRALIPVLLAHAEVLSVSQGRSLEQAYLGVGGVS